MLVQAGATSLLKREVHFICSCISHSHVLWIDGQVELFFKAFQSLSLYKNILRIESGSSLHCFLFVCSKQLEKELLEQQPKVNSLQELCSYLLLKSDGEDYIEAEEKVHVIGTKLKQLIEQVSHDLKTIQGNLVSQSLNTSLWVFLTEK